jgi:D-alanyl-D-alanine carboxypeptidase
MAAVVLVLLALLAAPRGFAGGHPDVDPRFHMSLEELQEASAELAPAVRARIGGEAKRFLGLMDGTLDLPPDLLVLVDKTHALPDLWAPPDLVPLEGYALVLNKKGLSLRAAVLPDLLSMVEKARGDGVTLPLTSTYRSYDYQVTIYERELKTKSREEVERDLAPPGHSQHQLGTVIDFGSVEASFAETRAGKWLSANAWRYGFSLSYPKGSESRTGYIYEPWHYRWVGRNAAELVEHFFRGDQQAFLSFLEEHRSLFEARRRS